MVGRIRAKLTYANVMSTLAVFVTLGGGAYAAAKLPANSVGTAPIKNKAITLDKINPRAQRTLRGQRGQTGAQGAPGARGADGAAGQAGTNALGASAYANDAAGVPPAGGTQSIVKQATITTSRPGKLVVVEAAIDAVRMTNPTFAPVDYTAGVYVDGTGVPGTGASCCQLPAQATNYAPPPLTSVPEYSRTFPPEPTSSRLRSARTRPPTTSPRRPGDCW